MWSVWLVFCDCGFHFVCPLMDKYKRLMEASWWERLWGKVGLVLMGGAMLSKSLIQFSIEGGRHYLHYLYHSLVSGQTAGREHSPAHQQKIRLKIYWAWPCPSEQDPVSPSISPSHQEASISLLSLSIRGQTDWKPQSQKTNQFDHKDHSLV